jgi:peptidoglycan/xylan/chitin deacetylase (PgdA/CDA1 family)
VRSLAFRVLRRGARYQPFPALLWRWHAALARRAGIDRFYLLLSFDCDTDKDIDVVESVVAKLERRKITATFAVPGVQLRRGRSTYRTLHQRGYEFIAHGDAEHCKLEDGRYVSSFFYDQLPFETVEQDIARSKATYADVFGEAPTGFRTPHFGSYQSGQQLASLHGTLRRLGFRFSSSTMPVYGFRHGPVRRFPDGFVEVPVSGCVDSPLSVLDSYGFRYAPGHRFGDANYVTEFTGMIDLFATRRWPGLMNTYVDPSQVHDFAGFFDALDHAAQRGVPSLTFSRLLTLLR